MDSIPAAAGTTPVTIHFSAAGILRRIIQGIHPGDPDTAIRSQDPGKGVYGLIIVIITAVPLYIASMSMSFQDRLFG